MEIVNMRRDYWQKLAIRGCWSLLAILLIHPICGAGDGGEYYGIGENVSLAELLDGSMIIAGDKWFGDFEYNLAEGDLDPEDIAVVGIYDDVLDGYGLLFSGDFVAGGLSSPLKLEAGLLFTVTALDPNYLISDVHLDGTTFVRGTGDAQIVENFVGVDVPSLSIYELRVDGELIDSKSSDDILFPEAIDVLGFRSLRVFKDISIESGVNVPLDRAEITTFQQVFTQLPVVPEPTSFVLLAMGLGATAWMRRRGC